MKNAVLADQVADDSMVFVSPAAKARIAWMTVPIAKRLEIVAAARHELAGMTAALAKAISPELARTPADTRVAEILPLLEACRFLERRAAKILAGRRLGRRGLPLWLAGVASEIHRVPLGKILVVGPANYPLFLPGVQVLQALVAGNAVIWKPGRDGKEVAEVFAEAMYRAGLPRFLLTVAEESVEAVYEALAEQPNKVFFTGSATVGRMLMRELAETLTPSVMELSGCDAVIVLPSADLKRVVKALVFGIRLNGSATCMAPRRILLVDYTDARHEAFLSQLLKAMEALDGVSISSSIRDQLRNLVNDAMRAGARVVGDVEAPLLCPVIVTSVKPEMSLAQADVFAPVLSVIDVRGEAGVLAAQEACPFALTTAIFGDEIAARRLATRVVAGSVLINDLIVPTADPRVPFGGRRGSGFGATRGAEGLLEMTAAKVIAVRRGRSTRHYERTTVAHESLFDGLIAAAHAGSWAERWRGMKQVAAVGRKLSGKG